MYKVLEDKVTHRKPNCVVDGECRRRAADDGPENFVQSYAALRSAIDVASAAEYERHICPCCSKVFPHLTKEQCESVPYARCTHCNHHRFRNPENPKALRAYKRMWVRPLKELLTSLFQDKAIVERMGGLRTGPKANRGWQYPYYQWLDHICHSKLTCPGDKEVAVMFCLGATQHTHQTIVTCYATTRVSLCPSPSSTTPAPAYV